MKKRVLSIIAVLAALMLAGVAVAENTISTTVVLRVSRMAQMGQPFFGSNTSLMGMV